MDWSKIVGLTTAGWMFLVIGALSPPSLAQDGDESDAETPVATETVAENEDSDAAPETEEVVDAAADFRRELRTVEEDVSDLKERVFRSKATLQLLKELLVDASGTGSRLVISHANELGKGYEVESLQVVVDGKSVFTDTTPGQTGLDGHAVIYDHAIRPGTHDVSVHMVLRGKGHKLFSYLSSYQFKVESNYPLTIETGKTLYLGVTADNRGGLRSFVERPTIRYEVREETFQEEQ